MELIHTCYRITDPERSTAFYEALGLEKRRELPIRDEAVNYFFGVPGKPVPELELTYNFGVDSYELGTAYGHIALTVENMTETLAKLAAQGIQPERAPYSVREGGSLLCFVRAGSVPAEALTLAPASAHVPSPEELTAIAAGYGIEVIGPPGIPA